MKYTVVWKPGAEADLATIWTNTDDRQAVADAADRIDDILSRNPEEAGESRSQSVRILFIDPVGVFFHVSVDDRIVSVLRVWIPG